MLRGGKKLVEERNRSVGFSENQYDRFSSVCLFWDLHTVVGNLSADCDVQCGAVQAGTDLGVGGVIILRLKENP